MPVVKFFAWPHVAALILNKNSDFSGHPLALDIALERLEVVINLHSFIYTVSKTAAMLKSDFQTE
jgi:hypothetical protein